MEKLEEEKSIELKSSSFYTAENQTALKDDDLSEENKDLVFFEEYI